MSIAAAVRLDKDRLARIADHLAIAIAVSLPWSTSATSILVVLWLVTLIPTIDLVSLRRGITTPAGGLPLLLFGLGAIGMLWANVPFSARLDGIESFAKLLGIPLLLVQFRRSDNALPVLAAFLISATALLALSLLLAMWPSFAGIKGKAYGVPVKDYIAQSGVFVLCAFGVAYVARDLFRAGHRFMAAGWFVLGAALLFDVLYIATGRTALVTIPFLILIFSLRYLNWKGAAGLVFVGIIVGAIIWVSSPYLQGRVMGAYHEVEEYQTEREATSAGRRLYFWKKSIGFISEAPIFGHGTGTIEEMFKQAATAESGYWERSANPHNQVFAVGIQSGVTGIALLFAMWLSHLVLFCRPGLIAWIGLAVVIQNIVGSLFNSHLFDFTQGWIYVFGVGVAGGAVLRQREKLRLISG
jgi:O-antigen ligase